MLRTGARAGVRALAVSGVLAVVSSGCQAQSSIVPAHDSDPVVVIETASFGESEIIGHIYGIYVAQREAVRVYGGDRKAALRVHLVMMVGMIGMSMLLSLIHI